jgi:PKD repeat protein
MLLQGILVLLFIGNVVGEGTLLVNLGDDLVTQEDSAVTINSAVSYTGTRSLSYLWTFGDGTISTLQRPSHTYTMAGNYTVTLTVTDSDGVSDADSVLVEVLNVRPIADAGGEKTVYEGTTVTFDGSSSWDTPSDLPLLTYEWNFGDGHATSASRENKVVTHTYMDAGVYVVRLVVRDDDWTSSNYAFMESQLIEVSGSSSGNGTLNFFFDIGNGTSSSNSSSTPDTTGWEFYWDFGDGTYAQGNNAEHTYEADGLYVVTLILTDAFGAMSVHNILVTVLNYPPTADAGEDVTVNEDATVQFHGLGSDPGGGPVEYSWTLGDGQTATGSDPTHSYTKQGTYTVTLTVTDSDGLTASDTCSVTVLNVVPTAGLTSDHQTEEGEVIAFYGVTSTDTPSDLPLLTYGWSFGDGGTATGISVSHAYSDEGTYTVVLTVTDDDGASDTTTMTVPVDNAAPVASITSVSCDRDPILPNDNVTFVGTGTDAGTSDTLTFAWVFGDGATGSGTSVVHAYTAAGMYTVRFTVTDDDGGTDTATTTVTVTSTSTVTEDAQDLVDEAPSTSFDKPKDQEFISSLFDDLMTAIDEGDSNKIDSRIHVLQVQVGNKVSDEDLRADLLAILGHLDESYG